MSPWCCSCGVLGPVRGAGVACRVCPELLTAAAAAPAAAASRHSATAHRRTSRRGLLASPPRLQPLATPPQPRPPPVATPGARTAAGGHTHQPPHHSAPLPPSYLSLSPGHVRPRDVRLCVTCHACDDTGAPRVGPRQRCYRYLLLSRHWVNTPAHAHCAPLRTLAQRCWQLASVTQHLHIYTLYTLTVKLKAMLLKFYNRDIIITKTVLK